MQVNQLKVQKQKIQAVQANLKVEDQKMEMETNLLPINLLLLV
jgi:hypothetical protein